MKGYFIHFNARDIIGVSKKIDLQLKELRKCADVTEICMVLRTKSVLINALAVVPFVSLAWDYREVYGKVKDADFVYFRGINYDLKHFRFLKWLKHANPNCRVMAELPTYPCEKEMRYSIQGKALFYKYLFYKRFLKNYVDRIVLTVNSTNKVFGIDTISIRNGIDVSRIVVSRRVKDENCINLIAVAMMQPAHGYERVIEGLYHYYCGNVEKKIVLNLVGAGPELKYYKELVRNYELENYVIFWGEKSGEELDRIYDLADIALDAFGWYKFQIDIISSLKCGEYMAKGLPVISGIRSETVEEYGDTYFCKVSNESDYINMEIIINFYNQIYGCYNIDVRRNIREYATKYFDMSITYKPVLEYLKT